MFSGIGGPEVAAAMLGWDNVFHCEINAFGRKILEYWFPESDSHEDITKTDFTKYRGTIDVLTGGFPCQPFSYAGKRGGQTDDRYLWPEMLRVIDEVRPTWVVGENVAGITTMVESCDITEMGSQGTLFQESDGVHSFRSEETFTIERVCQDLESKGYSVQPVLIPACAVGAPHRRDRVFIIAYNSDSCHDLRESGEHESKSCKERISERYSIWFTRESGDVRSEVQQSSTDSYCRGRSEVVDNLQPAFSDGKKSFCNGVVWNVADSIGKGLEREDKSRSSEGGERMCIRGDFARCGRKDYLEPRERWKGFPTVSAVHRRSDGLPFNVDNLAIPFSKWRNETIKAYGNAIVPQVMYRIFQCIEIING